MTTKSQFKTSVESGGIKTKTAFVPMPGEQGFILYSTPGQKTGNPPVAYTDPNLTILCGRKGSEDIAKSFRDALSNVAGSACVTNGYVNTYWPKKLNFWVRGKLSVEWSGGNILEAFVQIGQGHSATRGNDWWIGCPQMTGGPGVGLITIEESHGLLFQAVNNNETSIIIKGPGAPPID